jgi:hypothetical protein
MHLIAFRQQVKALGFDVRKRKGLEVLDITKLGSFLFWVSYDEIHPLANARDIFVKRNYKLPIAK